MEISVKHLFLKNTLPALLAQEIFHSSFLETIVKGIALFFRHVVSPRAFLELTERLFCFASAANRREGKAPKCFAA